jgi:hypothetical protein
LLMVMSGLNKVFINWAMHKEAAKSKGVTESMPLPEKIKMLKGLTVGVTNPGALTAHLAAFVIRKAGYTPQQDVQIIPIGAGPTWLAALENRKIDVALTAPPVPETAISRGFAIMFINNAKGEDPSIPEFLMENLVAPARDGLKGTGPGAENGTRAHQSKPMGAQEHVGTSRRRAQAGVGQNAAGSALGRRGFSVAGAESGRPHQRTQLSDNTRCSRTSWHPEKTLTLCRTRYQ